MYCLYEFTLQTYNFEHLNISEMGSEYKPTTENESLVFHDDSGHAAGILQNISQQDHEVQVMIHLMCIFHLFIVCLLLNCRKYYSKTCGIYLVFQI